MKTLTSPSCRVVLEIYRDREAGLVSRVEQASCFFRPHKKYGDFRFLNLVAFLQLRKPIRPLVCLSSKTQAEWETADAQIQETYRTKLMHVKFQLQKDCSFGQNFLIVGDDPMLGLWDPERAIPMDWSDGNVWSVKLDLPVGKSVQFKFILKGDAGSILWQPGPDRIFQTWETENTITVFEDWGDTELQKITEEAQEYNQIEDSNINSDMSIPEADNLTFPNEDPVFNNMESAFVDSYTDPAQIPLLEPYEEQIVADNLSVSQEKPKTVVGENTTRKWPKQMMEPNEEQMVARNNAPSEDSAAIPNEMMVAQNISGNNGRAATARNHASSSTEGSLMYYEEGPVLIPGLTRAPAVPTEEAHKEEVEKPMTFDGLVGDYEATELILPELEEKQELCTESPQVETVDMFSDKVMKFDEELKQKPQPSKRGNQSKPDLPNGSPQAETTDMLNNNEVNFDDGFEQNPQTAETAEQYATEQVHDVWHNDMQWGLNLLQKLLINLLP